MENTLSNAGVYLRPVSYSDIKKIYVWRNHPDVRKWMINTKEITWNEHFKFWDSYIKNNKGNAFIIVVNGKECGVIRLDYIDKSIAEIDIVIDPKFHNRGIGNTAIKQILSKSESLGIKKLIVKIKPDNIPSIKIFEKNDFKLKLLIYEKEV